MQGIRRIGSGAPAAASPRPPTDGIRSTPAAADAASRVPAARPATRQPAPAPPTRPPDPARRAHEALNERIQQAAIAALQGMSPARFSPPTPSLRPAAAPRAGGGGAAGLGRADAPAPPSPSAHGIAVRGVLSMLEGEG